MNAPTLSRPPVGTNRPTAPVAKPSIDFRAAIRKGPTERPPRIVLIGVEGVGKSTAGAQMEAPIFLCAEDGLVGPQFAEVPSYSAPSWDEALSFLDWLATEQHEFKSLVLDTLDWLEPKLYGYICKRDNKASVEDYGYGKGYIVAAEEFRILLGKLDAINRKGMAILVLAHSQIKAFNNPLGDNYDRYEPKVAKQIAGMTKEWADAVLFARFQVFTAKGKSDTKVKGFGGQERIVHTSHSAGWDAKNRYGLPDEMPLDMGAILDAIRSGNGAGGETADSLTAEIQNLSADLPADKKAAVEKATTEAGNDAASLGRVLNRVRVILQNLQKGNA